MASVLFILPTDGIAYSLTPATINLSEGNGTNLRVTADSGDWVEPNGTWISTCAADGIEDAKWVLIWKFHFLSETATFGEGPGDGDLHLTKNGARTDAREVLYSCSSSTNPPANERSWGQFGLVVNEDNIQEGTETATLIVHKVGINAINKIADQSKITINGDTPFSDWDVDLTSTSPIEVFPSDPISVTADGDRTINPDFTYTDGWAMVFLLSDDEEISLDDVVLESRSSDEFSTSFNENYAGPLSVEPGTYWIGACSTVNDDDPSNDCSEGRPVTVTTDERSPDLEVETVQSSATTIQNGEIMDIVSEIRNVGELTAAASTARIYLSMDEIAGADDYLLGTQATPELENRFFTRIEESYLIDVEAGDYYLLVCVDAVADETVLSNNCATGPLITATGGPSDGCTPTPLSCNEAVTGSLDALDCTGGPRGANHYADKFSFTGAVGDRLFLDAGWLGSLDGYLVVEDPNGLTVAQNDNFTGTSDSKVEVELKADGTYTVWATSFDAFEQGDYDLSLTCQSPPGADLVLDTPALDDTNPLPGQSLAMSSRLRNLGNASADSTTLRYVLSSDPVIDADDPEFGTGHSSRLLAGSSREASFELTAPTTPGTYYVGVCADPVTGEASVSNNCSAGRAITVGSQPACTSRVLSCGSFVTGILSSEDCASSPRGAGYLAEVMRFNVNDGREFVFSAEWNDFNGYMVLTDTIGAVVAQAGGNGANSRLEHKADSEGEYQLWVTSFDRNEMGTFGMDFRCGSSVAPDLNASPVSINDSSVSTNQNFSISAQVLNEGNVPSDPTTVDVMLSADANITAEDQSLVQVALPSLAAGQSRQIQLSLQSPASPGNYWLGICAEPGPGETLTENNCSVASSQASATESNGDKPRVQNLPEENGTLLTVTNGAGCNTGTLLCGGSAAGTLGAADCDAGPRGPGFPSDALTFSAARGDTISLNAAWTGLDGYLYVTDPSGAIVAQNDDFNGTAGSRMEVVLDQSGTFTVWPTAFDEGQSGSYQVELDCNNPQAPDLVVDAPELTTTSLRSGQSLNISTVVQNRGGFAAEAASVDFILARSPQVSASDRVLRSNDVPPLAGGAAVDEVTDVPVHATPGTYYVAACVSLDRQETAIANNCGVSGPITVENTGEPIEINSSLNDAWFNPSTSGQGFFINIFPDGNLAFLSWFTFDTTRPPAGVEAQLGDPGHRWLTAQGSYDQGVADLNIFLTEGGVFDNAVPAADTDAAPYGTMSVTFSDCNNGLIEYNLPSINDSGFIPITRVSSENVAACEASLGTPSAVAAERQKEGLSGIEANVLASQVESDGEASNGFHYNSSLNEAWFNPATNGQGFFFNIFPNSNFVFLSWFTYDLTRPDPGTPFQLGDPGHRWLTAQGTFVGDTAEMKVFETGGGVFNAGSLPPSSTVEIGTMTASFDHCNSGLVSYDIDSVGRANDVPIRRVAPDNIPACEVQSNAEGGSGPFGESNGVTTGVTPSGRPTLENACNGEVNWKFEWPDSEDVSYYEFELYRSDSSAGSPRVHTATTASEFSYFGKEDSVGDAYLENWFWRYRPVMARGDAPAASWSKEFYFNVRPASDPCE